MANQDWGFGLQPVSGPYNAAPQTTRFPLKQFIQSTTPQQTAIFKGQVVLWNETVGCIKPTASTNSANVIGVAAEYYAGSATTKTDLAVWSAHDHEFLIQSDGGTTSTDRASYLMKNFALVNPASGVTASGLSKSELDFSSGQLSTGTNPLRAIGFRLHPGDTVKGANVNVVVRFNDGFAYQSDVTIT